MVTHRHNSSDAELAAQLEPDAHRAQMAWDGHVEHVGRENSVPMERWRTRLFFFLGARLLFVSKCSQMCEIQSSFIASDFIEHQCVLILKKKKTWGICKSQQAAEITARVIKSHLSHLLLKIIVRNLSYVELNKKKAFPR